MTERAYKNISIKTEFAEAIEQFIRANPQLGYRSIAQFLEDSSRRRLEDLKAAQLELPPMEHSNFDEDGVKISDNRTHETAQIYFKPEGMWCELCEKAECEHIKFALEQRQIQKQIRKKRKEGWKLPNV